MEIKKVKGKKIKPVMLYALSTCVWCKKTKKFLEDLGVEYDFIFVDMEKGDDAAKLEKEIEKWNPEGGFPTIVIDNKECIVGFKPDDIKEKLGV